MNWPAVSLLLSFGWTASGIFAVLLIGKLYSRIVRLEREIDQLHAEHDAEQEGVSIWA